MTPYDPAAHAANIAREAGLTPYQQSVVEGEFRLLMEAPTAEFLVECLISVEREAMRTQWQDVRAMEVRNAAHRLREAFRAWRGKESGL